VLLGLVSVPAYEARLRAAGYDDDDVAIERSKEVHRVRPA